MSLSEEQQNFLHDLFEAVEANPGKISDWEKGFLTDNKDRFDAHGAELRVSTKQWAIFVRVGDKLGLG